MTRTTGLLTLKKYRPCDIVRNMGNGKIYPEKRDIRAIAVLLATQGMIRLGEIPDPLSGEAALDAEGARFFIDLLQELQHKTENNLQADEAAFLVDMLENMRQLFAKKKDAPHG
jgi:hypothetical protein